MTNWAQSSTDLLSLNSAIGKQEFCENKKHSSCRTLFVSGALKLIYNESHKKNT